jgi:periplasmic divalent cation tolerance protein
LTKEFIEVFTATARKEDAEKMSFSLVDKKLAGCVQIIGPISSTYWWKGKIESNQEWLCIIKTKRTLFEKLRAAIRAVHSYEVPEITAVPIVAGNKDYLRWLQSVLIRSKRETGPAGDS